MGVHLNPPTSLQQCLSEKGGVEEMRYARWRAEFLTAISVWLPVISPGMGLGFSAVALPQLRYPNANCQLTEDQATWFASCAVLAAPLGVVIAHPLVFLVGRKMALLFANLVSFFGWFLIAHAPLSSMPLAQLFTGRMLTGLSLGLVSVPANNYVHAMIASSDQASRGILTSCTSMFVAIGVFLVYILGAMFSWVTVAFIAMILTWISAVIVGYFVPENPPWLSTEDTSIHSREPIGTKTYTRLGVKDRLYEFCKPQTYNPLFIMSTFLLVQQLSGVYVIMCYMVDIVDAVSTVNFSGYYVAVIAANVVLVTKCWVIFILPTVGVRRLALCSGTGMHLSMTFLLGYMFLVRSGYINEDATAWNWCPVVTILTYVMSYSMGFSFLPWAMLEEVFPEATRGVASGLTTCVGNILCFAVLQMYGRYEPIRLFYLFACASYVGTLFLYCYLPETRGKSLQQIEDEFTRSPYTPSDCNVSVQEKCVVRNAQMVLQTGE